MKRRTVRTIQRTPASPGQVWHLLGDVTTWTDWAPIREATLEEPAFAGGDGVGAIRSLRTATGTTRELVTVHDAPHHLGYALISGLPLQDYRSDVTLTPDEAGGTVITWTSTFDASWWWGRAAAVIVGSFCRRLARAAPKVTATRHPAA